MKQLDLGRATYDLAASIRPDGRWVATAVRAGTNERFGIECAGHSEQAAIDRLCDWLTWQREHTDALERLQQAERAYHRTVAGTAFTTPGDGLDALELQRESLHDVEAARIVLDEIRARRPPDE